MRKLAIFTFAIYITVFLSPVGMAIVTDSELEGKTCFGGVDNLTDAEMIELKNEKAGETADTEIATIMQTRETALENSYKTDNCGKANGYNDTLEKGDCTEAKKYITEITEVIGGQVSTDDGEVLNVYKGICCLASGGTTAAGTYYCNQTDAVYTVDYSTCSSKAAHCEKRQWIIASTGAGIIKTYVKQIYIFAASIIGFISVCVIIFSGIQISISGVSGSIEEAKERIIQSIMGLVLLFLSGLILYTINPTFFS